MSSPMDIELGLGNIRLGSSPTSYADPQTLPRPHALPKHIRTQSNQSNMQLPRPYAPHLLLPRPYAPHLLLPRPHTTGSIATITMKRNRAPRAAHKRTKQTIHKLKKQRAVSRTAQFVRTKRKYKSYKDRAISKTRAQFPTYADFIAANCENTLYCMAMGDYYRPILDIFGHFKTLPPELVKSRRQVGAVSANGIATELVLEKEGIRAYLLQKTVVAVPGENPDNLMYEYKVGEYINTKAPLYPCFVHTMPLLYKTGDTIREYPDTDDWTLACTSPRQLILNVQYFHPVIPFGAFIKQVEATPYPQKQELLNDVYAVLFQVYFALEQLKDEFTHYDLHYNNVLLYKPYDKTSSIEMNYLMPDGTTTTFHTHYIAKIIDYGRCFIPASFALMEKMSQTTGCDPTKGFGFTSQRFFVPEKNQQNPDFLPNLGFVDPVHANPSHDLRLLFLIETLIPMGGVYFPYTGEDHRRQPPFSDQSPFLYTVSDVIPWLLHVDMQPHWIRGRVGGSIIARMHVYSDGRHYTFETVDPEHEIPRAAVPPPDLATPISIEYEAIVALQPKKVRDSFHIPIGFFYDMMKAFHIPMDMVATACYIFMNEMQTHPFASQTQMQYPTFGSPMVAGFSPFVVVSLRNFERTDNPELEFARYLTAWGSLKALEIVKEYQRMKPMYANVFVQLSPIHHAMVHSTSLPTKEAFVQAFVLGPHNYRRVP